MKKWERVYEELISVFGNSDRECEQQDLVDLKYLELCIREALRLYPIVPVIYRELQEDTQLGLFKYKLYPSILKVSNLLKYFSLQGNICYLQVSRWH